MDLRDWMWDFRVVRKECRSDWGRAAKVFQVGCCWEVGCMLTCGFLSNCHGG